MREYIWSLHLLAWEHLTGTTSGHLARAGLESIAHQVTDLLDAMRADSSVALTELRVDGGATVNKMLMQFQSDLLNIPVVKPKITETTALGAAYLAGLAVGYWSSIDEIQEQWQTDITYHASIDDIQRRHLSNDWRRAIRAAQVWAENME